MYRNPSSRPYAGQNLQRFLDSRPANGRAHCFASSAGTKPRRAHANLEIWVSDDPCDPHARSHMDKGRLGGGHVRTAFFRLANGLWETPMGELEKREGLEPNVGRDSC